MVGSNAGVSHSSTGSSGCTSLVSINEDVGWSSLTCQRPSTMMPLGLDDLHLRHARPQAHALGDPLSGGADVTGRAGRADAGIARRSISSCCSSSLRLSRSCFQSCAMRALRYQSSGLLAIAAFSPVSRQSGRWPRPIRSIARRTCQKPETLPAWATFDRSRQEATRGKAGQGRRHIDRYAARPPGLRWSGDVPKYPELDIDLRALPPPTRMS